MAMSEIQVRLWARRKWWVDPFLTVAYWAVRPFVPVLPEAARERYVDWVGWVIGRFGVHVYAD